MTIILAAAILIGLTARDKVDLIAGGLVLCAVVTLAQFAA